mmetsp:Transcript_28778/g.66017  ORF Transcript_28778/g.66017 Transcript_28778/m.66017 type:complete len:232 (+) Transcript_28778:418-1113(+)
MLRLRTDVLIEPNCGSAVNGLQCTLADGVNQGGRELVKYGAALGSAPELVDVQPLGAAQMECLLEILVRGRKCFFGALVRRHLTRRDGLRLDGQRGEDRACERAPPTGTVNSDRAARCVEQCMYLAVGRNDVGCDGGVLGSWHLRWRTTSHAARRAQCRLVLDVVIPKWALVVQLSAFAGEEVEIGCDAGLVLDGVFDHSDRKVWLHLEHERLATEDHDKDVHRAAQLAGR